MGTIKSILLVLLLSYFAQTHASVAIELEAGIINLQTPNGKSQVILNSEGEELEISNQPQEFMGCVQGRFLVIESLEKLGTYTVVEFLSCSQFEDQTQEESKQQHSYSCPKIFEPVCGTFEKDFTLNYGNKCELIHSGGNFLHEGYCE